MEKNYKDIVEDGIKKCELRKLEMVDNLLSKLSSEDWIGVSESAEEIQLIILELQVFNKYLEI